MKWKPITRESLDELITGELAEATAENRERFAHIAITPSKWQLSPWGDHFASSRRALPILLSGLRGGLERAVGFRRLAGNRDRPIADGTTGPTKRQLLGHS
jgi:hypothetical protein